MKKAILATKVGMTQIFGEDGSLTPVTVLQAGPCVVTQVKTVENDGYSAVQVGFVDKREKLVNKCQKGHFDKAGVSYKRYVRELKLDNAEEYALGAEIKADAFAAGDKIDANCYLQGQRLPGCYQETRSAERTDGTRLQVPSSCRFQRRLLRSFQGIQGQEDGRSHGQQKNYHPESGSSSRRCRCKSDPCKRLCTRTEEVSRYSERDR